MSPSRAKADKRVGDASLCLSISSSTSTNFPLCSGIRAARHSSNNTARVLICSQRPFPNFSHSSFCPKASRVFHKILVRRCRPVIHSLLRTTACGTSSVERTPRIIVDLHVAEIPWTTSVEGLGRWGCNIQFTHQHTDSRSGVLWWIELEYITCDNTWVTHIEQGSKLPRLHLSTWPLSTQVARNVKWLHN